MELLRATVLGVIQGLAEFLPISSSGHLRLVQDVFHWNEFGLAFDTLLHLATLLAVMVYFRADLVHMVRSAFSRAPERAADRRLAWLVVVATIPTGIIGLVGSDWFENADILFVGISFLVTAVVLTAAEALSRKSLHTAENLGWGKALLVGVAQGVAVMPGISRSGATMASGLGLGLDREQAARFSFLLSFPIILLAGAKQGLDVLTGAGQLPSPVVMLAGFVAAALTGYLAIAGLMAYLRKHSLYVFAVYTAILGVVVVVWRLTS